MSTESSAATSAAATNAAADPGTTGRRRILPAWATGFGAQVIYGLIIGLILGFIARGTGEGSGLRAVLDSVGGAYVQLLKLMVPPLVVTAVITSVANLRKVTNAARLAVSTLLWFAATSLISVIAGILIGLWVKPGVGAGVDAAAAEAPSSTGSWWAFLAGVVPENILGLGVNLSEDGADPAFNVLQLLVIYRKEITNWKEVGGPDAPITVYYRDDQSGSQRLFEKLVWKGEEIPDFGALGFQIEDAMSSIVDMVQWDPYAIGYTIMTYLGDVYGEDALRVFSINGVSPSPETVADGTYAYHTQGYLVIRADEPEGSPARRLFDWFGCPISADLLDRCGVTPLKG